MIFKRNTLKDLEVWKSKNNRKPLIIRGARQVGKTTLVKEFARSYKYSILLNLDKPSDLDYFSRYTQVRSLLESLFLTNNISIEEIDKTLLFIDEIQESPNAIQMLRYFYEEFPELHVIAAGSLLEFAMRKVKSFPVGRVEYVYMHPLNPARTFPAACGGVSEHLWNSNWIEDSSRLAARSFNFREFLMAKDHMAALEQLDKIPFDSFAHKILLDLFNQYAIVGGMPEVISSYIEKKSYTELPAVYESIRESYRNKSSRRPCDYLTISDVQQ